MPAAISTARLEARISTDLNSMLKRAAELQGRTMTDFVIAAVQAAAQRAIDHRATRRRSPATRPHRTCAESRLASSRCLLGPGPRSARSEPAA